MENLTNPITVQWGAFGAVLIALALYHVMRERRWDAERDKLTDKLIELAGQTAELREVTKELREIGTELKLERRWQEKALRKVFNVEDITNDGG